MHKKVIRDTVYYYTSVRENGRVKTIYLGRTEAEAVKRENELKKAKSHAVFKADFFGRNILKTRPVLYLSLAVLVVAGLLLLRNGYVGYVTVSGPDVFLPGEKLNGTVNLTFFSQEFYPKDTLLEVAVGEQTLNMSLGQLLQAEAGLYAQDGEYYVIGSNLSGSGEGFGVRGERKIFPEVAFSYGLSCILHPENSTNETYAENYTGLFSGSCSANAPYFSRLAENLTDCSAALIAGSVHAGNLSLDESYVELRIEDGMLIGETGYYETESGYGAGYESAVEASILKNLDVFDIGVPETSGTYVLGVRLVYNSTVLREALKNITISELPQNETQTEKEANATEVAVELPEISDADKDGDPDMTDCNPSNAAVYHGVAELCNGVDDNCDAATDEGFDFDGDGYVTCGDKLDCDDNDPAVHPGAEEICDDGKDNDCDGAKDMDDPYCLCSDNDKDGFDTCHEPIDCDDNEPKVNPKAKEICGNMIDENCDGFDKACSNAREIIEARKIKGVKEEVLKDVESGKATRLIVRLKDAGKKMQLMGKFTPEAVDVKMKKYFSGIFVEQDLAMMLDQFPDAIESVQVDHRLDLFADDVINHTGVNLVWDMNLTGKGQTVCVVDSGIDYNHPDVAGNYIGGYDFVNEDADPLDDNGHGTYVSGIVAGIAKDSKILVAKAFNGSGAGYESDILEAIDYCINNRDTYNVSVMLMAFGGGEFNTSCYCDSNLVANESNFAVSQGIFAVAASGNDGDAYLKAPACGTNVTSVGAVDENDSVADFTNIEPLLDLLAPGVDIQAANMGGGHVTRSGTSASAAIVAGIAPLIFEGEALAPLELQYRLRSTGALISYHETIYPRTDAYAAATGSETNTPAGQQGNQCEGTWKDYEPLAVNCLADCENSCSTYCIRTGCQDISQSGCSACNAYCTRTCNKATCLAECAVDGDCTADYCAGTCGTGTNSCIWRDYYCNTAACTACSCTYTTTDADDLSARCTSCMGSGFWNLGGTYTEASCCGDDSGEYRITETSGGSYTPAGYDDAGTTCCSASSNCAYTAYGYPDECVASGSASAPAVPNRAACSSNYWYGGDDGSSYCTIVVGSSGNWGLGGEGSGSCCGDDSSESTRTEQSTGTDIPAGYNDGSKTCCSDSSDCSYTAYSYSDVCKAYQGTSDPAVPNKAYCGSSSTWWGGDDLSAACTAITGGSNWGLGGEVPSPNCCGDDSSEYPISEAALGATTPAGYNDGSYTCCDASTDCAYTAYGYSDICKPSASGSSSASDPTIPNKAYCQNKNWYGGDDLGDACSAITGGSNWGLGGEGDGSCCGDDSSEYAITEASSTDTPSPYNDNTGKTCCDTSGDCTESGTDVCTVTTSAAGTIPNKAYCGASNTWYGGDAGETYCTTIVAASSWNLGGEAWSSPDDLCCGDDSSEYKKTETGSTDAPSGYNDGITTCCDASTDCTYDDTCTATTGTSAPAIPSKAYCSSGTWYGGDVGSTQCTAIVGAGNWSIGGEVNATACCGDDSGENRRIFVDYLGNAHGVMDWGTSQDGCCDNANDQIDYDGDCVTSSGSGGNAVDTGYTGHDKYGYPYTTGWLDLDGHSTWPTTYGANVCGGGWINMSYGDSTGEDCGTAGGDACDEDADYGCCGDDSGENYIYRLSYSDQVGGSTATNTSDYACCDAATDCVYNSVCYAQSTWHDFDGNGVSDSYCYGANGWLNADRYTSYCTANHWNIGGDADLEGSYYQVGGGRTDYCDIGAAGYPSRECCCGDDSGENYRYCQAAKRIPGFWQLHQRGERMLRRLD